MTQDALTYERDFIQNMRLDYLRYVPKGYGTIPTRNGP